MATYFHHTDVPGWIHRDGFTDYLHDSIKVGVVGVLLTDRAHPNDPQLAGSTVVEVFTGADLSEYRVADAAAGYARWVVPADVLNTVASVE